MDIDKESFNQHLDFGKTTLYEDLVSYYPIINDIVQGAEYYDDQIKLKSSIMVQLLVRIIALTLFLVCLLKTIENFKTIFIVVFIIMEIMVLYKFFRDLRLLTKYYLNNKDNLYISLKREYKKMKETNNKFQLKNIIVSNDIVSIHIRFIITIFSMSFLIRDVIKSLTK